jgi:hypothetical protein
MLPGEFLAIDALETDIGGAPGSPHDQHVADDTVTAYAQRAAIDQIFVRGHRHPHKTRSKVFRFWEGRGLDFRQLLLYFRFLVIGVASGQMTCAPASSSGFLFHRHPEGSPLRRRGDQPPADAARRPDPQAGVRPLHLDAAGPARAAQGRAHRARGNEPRRRARSADAGRAAGRAVAGVRPLGEYGPELLRIKDRHERDFCSARRTRK